MPRRHRDLDETRALLLDTGAAMVKESGVRVSLAHVGLIDVCRRAGFRSAGSGYKIWATQEEFQADLMRHVAALSADEEPGPPSLAGLIEEIGAGPEHLAELVRRASNLQAEFIGGDHPAYELYLAFWFQRRTDPEIADLVRQADRRVLRDFAAMYAEGVFLMGHEFVAPFTAETLAVAIAALSEGMGIRLGSDPESVPHDLVCALGPDDTPREWHLLAASIWALVKLMTRPRRAADDAPSADS